MTYIPVSFLFSFNFRVRVTVKKGLGLGWVLGLGFGIGKLVTSQVALPAQLDHALARRLSVYGGQKAIDTHRYNLLQLVVSGDATLL